MSNPHRSSFGGMLLRRKSGEMKGGRKAQQAREREAELARQASIAAQPPPKLPQLYNGLREPVFETRDSVAIFGADQSPQYRSQPRTSTTSSPPGRPSMDIPIPRAVSANVPVPPIPNGNWVDPYARAESMTNRGRYSYASSAVSTVQNPRRVRRRKDPTPFK